MISIRSRRSLLIPVILVLITGYFLSQHLSATKAKDLLSPAEPISVWTLTSPLERDAFDGPGEFRFITPIAPNPHDPGADLDAGMLQYLTATICRVDGVSCFTVKTFNWQGPSSERLRILTTARNGSYFIANWDTSGFFLDDATYRISVDAAGVFLGSIDLPAAAYRQFGRTWPIKFIVEKDADLRAQVIQASGGSMWEVAADLMTDLGVCGPDLFSILQTKFPDAPDAEIQMVVDNVCQDVIIPESTKIADPATRAALAFYDKETGRLVFSEITSLLGSLKNKDVIVSKPAPGAPYGFMRKIKSLRKDGSTLTLETEQAKFSEAITMLGPTNVSGQLKAPAAPEANRFSSTKAGGTTKGFVPAIDEGDAFDFKEEIHAQIVLESEEGDVEGSGTINVDGFVHFNAAYNIGLGVEGCFELPPICVDRVEAWMGVEQQSKLKVTGNFEGRLTKEEEIAEVPMQPIVFFIGPFPVWIQPSVEILLGVNGEARVDFDFEAGVRSKIKVGAKWTDPDDGGIGWENLNEYNPIDDEYFNADMVGKVKLEAYGKVDAKLLFYSVFGPGINASVGISGDADTGRSPLWTIRGHVRSAVNVGADAGGYFDIGEVWSEDILDEEFIIEEAPNIPPQCFWRTDQIAANVLTEVYLGPSAGGFGGFFSCTDPEGEAITYSAASRNTADPAISSDMKVTFQTGGDRIVDVTARDASGETTSFSLNIRVFNAAPDVWFDSGADSIPAGVPYRATGRAFDLETQSFLTCDRLVFSASPNATVVEDDSNGCGSRIVFGQEGPATVTITATDINGAQNTATKNVTVTARPNNLPPEITFFEVRALRGPSTATDCILLGFLYCRVQSGDYLVYGPTGQYEPPLFMYAEATDPEGDGVTIEFFCKTGNFQALVEMTSLNSGTCEPALDPFYPVEVYAIANDGVSFSDRVQINLLVLQAPN